MSRNVMSELTPKEAEVLELVARRLTIKEIAAHQGVSPAMINKRIRKLKDFFGANSLSELAVAHEKRESQAPEQTAQDEYTNSRPTKNDLSESAVELQFGSQDENESALTFSDSYAWPADAPWSNREPGIVPEMFDGKHAGLFRFAAMGLIVILILAMVILGLTAAMTLTEVLG